MIRLIKIYKEGFIVYNLVWLDSRNAIWEEVLESLGDFALFLGENHFMFLLQLLIFLDADQILFTIVNILHIFVITIHVVLSLDDNGSTYVLRAIHTDKADILVIMLSKFSNHYIIKFIGIMPMYYPLNLDIVLAYMVFLAIMLLCRFKSIILFFLKKKNNIIV